MSPGTSTPKANDERSLRTPPTGGSRKRLSLSVITRAETDDPSHLSPLTPESASFSFGTSVGRQRGVTEDSFLSRPRCSTDESHFSRQRCGSKKQGLRGRANTSDGPIRNFSWVAKGAKGIFPGTSVQLSQVEHPQDLTDVDVSQNQISELDLTVILLQIPSLQRLNLAHNLLTSLACVVPLGVLPHLEELDIRGNPCCPEPVSFPARARILATLLAPEVSTETRIASAAEAAVATAASVVLARARLAPQEKIQALEQRRGVKHGSLMLSPPGRKPAMRLAQSGSAPALLAQVPQSQSPFQSRAYRSQHMQGAEAVTTAEQAARSHLQEIRRSCSGEISSVKETYEPTLRRDRESHEAKWEARHDQDIKRRVRGFLPRAHLYHAVVGSCYEHGACGEDQHAPSWGAGTKDWFPKLLVLNGAMVTVQDLEEVASYADELSAGLHAKNGQRSNTEEQTDANTSVRNLRMGNSESCSDFLDRFRTAFVKYRRQPQSTRPIHFSSDYDGWRKRSEAKLQKARRQEARRQQAAKMDDVGHLSSCSDSDELDSDDAEHYVFNTPPDYNEASTTSLSRKPLHSPANSASTRVPSSSASPFTETGSQLESSWMTQQSPERKSGKDCVAHRQDQSEEQLAQSMELDLWESQRRVLGYLEQGGMIPDPSDNGSATDNFCETPQWLTQLHYETQIRRPQSATTTRSTKNSYDFLQTHVPCNSLTTKKQGAKLQKTYATVVAAQLPDAVKAAMSSTLGTLEIDFAAMSSALGSPRGSTSGDDGLGNDDLRSKGLARLRSLGLAPSSGNSKAQQIACGQWLNQLKEDYPDKFNRARKNTLVGEAKPFRNFEVEAERLEDAILSSNLFVLNIHGDPSAEKDWESRKAWLSSNGRIWLTNCALFRGSPTLYLGGHCVSDVQVLPVGHSEAVARINGAPVYVLRFDFPGSRFTRKKYFATTSAQARDDWIRKCSSHQKVKRC